MSVTSDRSVVFSGNSGFLHQYNWPPWYSWNIVESGVNTINLNLHFIVTAMTWLYFNSDWYLSASHLKTNIFCSNIKKFEPYCLTKDELYCIDLFFKIGQWFDVGNDLYINHKHFFCYKYIYTYIYMYTSEN